MAKNVSPLQAAFELLSREVAEKNLQGVLLELVGEIWVRIELRHEARVAWLGHQDGRGYFLSWSPDAVPAAFFALDRKMAGAILALPARAPVGAGAELVEAMAESTPDPGRLKEILDRIPATDRGLNTLVELAGLRAFRAAIDRLRYLVESQAELKHSEQEFQRHLASCPWLIGTQYTATVEEEWPLSVDTRADLLLVNALGRIDVIELKRPDTVILAKERSWPLGRIRWRASHHLSSALSQARTYLRELDENRLSIRHRLRDVPQSIGMYRSSVLIVAGRSPDSQEALEALRDMNVENARILIVTYDDLLLLAEATIRVVERRSSRHPEGEEGH
jgi:hypothetical protein